MEEQNDIEEHLKSSHPISVLRNNTMKLLSAKLNPPKVINTSEGLSRNWKGFAELCSIESYLISNWEFSSDPMKEVLKIWQAKGNEATIGRMVVFLQKLDRWDVVEDISTPIAEDIEFHVQHPKDHKKQSPLYQDLDNSILTVDDVEHIEKNKQLIQYDAFVLFADDDIDFATEVIETMEKQYSLKFCVKDYLIGGLFEHEAIIRLISQRCEKLIVILSPSFFKSPMNKFFLNFTQAMSLEQRKIIPCLYKPCPVMPPEIRCYFMLDYTKPRVLWNFWDKLYESIKTKKAPANASNRVVRRDQPPRQLIIKNNSQRDTEFRLRAPNVAIKSNSLVDLTKSEADHILPEVNLIPSTSANSISFCEPEKKTKPKKYNWLKKLLPKQVKYVKRKPVAAT
ncbi:myeloid differentiation primary response protein MyD88 [Coccinella septempunctata]|uniref:myeloid differentiation primary response protein MyD88 n=1 Tax=Coccinella septempunctata TaxID=41139 RepID=UPI001D075A70|nr:myeloid differentiation primary response protein MyD88 [Coccinella septempunctata]XP_044763457.1 myeloid differentiation primary response protein MyD88 [Coccinella septempunctata]